MSSDILLIIATLILGFLLLYIFLKRQLDSHQPVTDPTIAKWLESMQHNLNFSNQNLTSTLQKSYQDLHSRLETATQIIGDLKREAGAFSEVSRSVRDLQDYLKNPKIRGNLGEQVLKDLITQMFPKNSFFIQHRFKNGSIVDAAIKTDAGILPIDSKLPMENFQRLAQSNSEVSKSQALKAFARDVQKHVKDISSKYILPSEGTMDFALMYLPSESVYYEVVNHPELIEFARQHRVYPVSPTTLYAHLQTILLSFEGKKVESRSREVFSLLRSIQSDYQKLETNFNVLNRHLTNAYNQMNNTNQSFDQLGRKIDTTRLIEADFKEKND